MIDYKEPLQRPIKLHLELKRIPDRSYRLVPKF